MPEPGFITVHNFRMYGRHAESPEVSAFKATRQAIDRAGGEPVPGTAQDVPEDEVDDAGHYRRINTGWGALD